MKRRVEIQWDRLRTMGERGGEGVKEERGREEWNWSVLRTKAKNGFTKCSIIMPCRISFKSELILKHPSSLHCHIEPHSYISPPPSTLPYQNLLSSSHRPFRRRIQHRIQHRPHPPLHLLHCLPQHPLQLRRRPRPPRPQLPARRRLGNIRIIRARLKRNIQLFICGLRASAIRVHEQERAFRGLPAGVVEDDSEDGEAVAAGDPVHGGRDGEEVGAVADDLADKAGGAGSEFEAEGCAAWR